MATESELLQIALDRSAQQIADFLAEPMKPSYSVGGRSFSWGEFYRQLIDRHQALRTQLIASQGPWQRDIVVTS